MIRALGVDVGARRHDAVLLDGTVVTDLRDLRSPDELGGLLERHRPDVVAIDAPPRFAPDGVAYREAERRLRAHEVQAFYVPPASRGAGSFHDWMRAGFGLFDVAAACGYPLACRVEDAAGGAIEAFPHGAAVVLAGRLPPRGLRGAARRRWRQTVLAEQGVAVDFAVRADHRVDATLAALCGVRAVEGRACAVGDPTEGAVFLPVTRLPKRYER